MKTLRGYEGLYAVSSDGQVRSYDRVVPTHGGTRTTKGRVLKQTPDAYGYPTVKLVLPGTRGNTQKVHVLVANAFIGSRPIGLDVCHKDSNKLNNDVSNLWYATRQRNHADKVGVGTSTRSDQSRCKSGKHAWVLANLRYIAETDSMRCQRCVEANQARRKERRERKVA